MTKKQVSRTLRRLLQAARGRHVPGGAAALSSQSTNVNAASPSFPQLPCFSLCREHIGNMSSNREPPSPDDFHSRLCQMIRAAKYRVQLASLYVGAASSGVDAPKERELLDALKDASSRPEVNVTVLMDENRALRQIRQNQKNSATSSAEAVHKCLGSTYQNNGGDCNFQAGVYLFQALNEFKTLLPSPLNEVAGVMHIKAYIVDDSLILSGANLSEEYFEDRQDRYMQFDEGGGGLVDFYSKLIEILCRFASPYTGSPTKATKPTKKSKDELLVSLSDLFDGSNGDDVNDDSCNATVGYAIPTFQAPLNFFSIPMPFPSDVQVTRNLMLTALEDDPASFARLSSAYLNPTRSLMSVLSRFGTTPSPSGAFGAAQLLTAGGVSHGFAPKTKKRESHGSGRDWIPMVFEELTREAAHHIIPQGGKILVYERPEWTFHSKGLWLSTSSGGRGYECKSNQDEIHIADAKNLVASIIGSGNYGARSEDLDIESNCILLLPDDSPLKESLAHEWNSMCSFATEWDGNLVKSQNESTSPFPVRAALPYIRNLF